MHTRTQRREVEKGGKERKKPRKEKDSHIHCKIKRTDKIRQTRREDETKLTKKQLIESDRKGLTRVTNSDQRW